MLFVSFWMTDVSYTTAKGQYMTLDYQGILQYIFTLHTCLTSQHYSRRSKIIQNDIENIGHMCLQ